MTAFYLILILIGEVVVLTMVSGAIGVLTRFRFPIILLNALLCAITCLFLAWKFWLLFGAWYANFVVGAAALSAAFLVFGIVTMVMTNTFSPDKNARANVLLMVAGQTQQGPLLTLVNLLALAGGGYVLFHTYMLSRGEHSPELIRDALFFYFTIGSVPGLVLACMQLSRTALNRTTGHVVRNIMAINSVGGFAVQAWRAAFPFLFLGGTFTFMGYEITLETVLIVLSAAYVLFVILPVFFGDRLHKEDRETVYSNAQTLLEQVSEFGDSNLNEPAFTQKRRQLASAIDQQMIDLLDNDPLLKFFVFWRWGPNELFVKSPDNQHWLLSEEASPEVRNDRFLQPLSVVHRAWFEALLGAKKRFKAYPLVENSAVAFLERVPTWNYRAAVFDELVMVLEELEGDAPRNAGGLAKIARKKLTDDARPSGGSIIGVIAQAAWGGAQAAGLALFSGQIRDAIIGLAQALGVA